MIIALGILFFVGNAFYDLAGLYNKSQWGFGILGALSYYAGQLLLGVVLAFAAPDFLLSITEGGNGFILHLAGIPFGAIACRGFYQILKSQWSKKATYSSPEDVLDGDMININKEL